MVISDVILKLSLSEEDNLDKQVVHLQRLDKMDQQLIDSAIKQWHKTSYSLCFWTRWTPRVHLLKHNSSSLAKS